MTDAENAAPAARLRVGAPSARVAVKTCGMNARNAVDMAVAEGARYLGFVFFPRSPRNVSPDEAAALATGLPDGVETVGVVVDPEDAALDTILASVRLDYLQLHGRESPARARAIRARTGCRIVKALGVSAADDIVQAAAYREVADAILFDAKPPPSADRPGGNAVALDWTLFAEAPPAQNWFLSGGLSADNVGQAIALTGAPAVDVSSGIESAPGRKDMAKMQRFFAAVAAAAREKGP